MQKAWGRGASRRLQKGWGNPVPGKEPWKISERYRAAAAAYERNRCTLHNACYDECSAFGPNVFLSDGGPSPNILCEGFSSCAITRASTEVSFYRLKLFLNERAPSPTIIGNGAYSFIFLAVCLGIRLFLYPIAVINFIEISSCGKNDLHI